MHFKNKELEALQYQAYESQRRGYPDEYYYEDEISNQEIQEDNGEEENFESIELMDQEKEGRIEADSSFGREARNKKHFKRNQKSRKHKKGLQYKGGNKKKKHPSGNFKRRFTNKNGVLIKPWGKTLLYDLQVNRR